MSQRNQSINAQPQIRFNSNPKSEAIEFEDNPVAMRYQRCGAQKFWDAIARGTGGLKSTHSGHRTARLH